MSYICNKNVIKLVNIQKSTFILKKIKTVALATVF